jgi:hypothetical protein
MDFDISKLTDWIWNNKEWLFSGVGLAVMLFIIDKFRNKNSQKYERINKQQPETPVETISDLPQQSESQIKSNIIEYVINPINPNLTELEIEILKKIIHFPRSQYTQGYRLDWIYNELLADRPNGIVYMVLESLLKKGFLEKWTTRRGNRYYTISQDVIPLLIENGICTELELNNKNDEDYPNDKQIEQNDLK